MAKGSNHDFEELVLVGTIVQILRSKTLVLYGYPQRLCEVLLSRHANAAAEDCIAVPSFDWFGVLSDASSPLTHITRYLVEWGSRGSFPGLGCLAVELEGVEHVFTAEFVEDRLTPTVSSHMEVFREALKAPARDGINERCIVESLLLQLTPAGLLMCLGLRFTVGSLFYDRFPSQLEPPLPIRGCTPFTSPASTPLLTRPDDTPDHFILYPSREVLLQAFQLPHKKGTSSLLTVGARALAKHCHRSSDGWWGHCSGPELAKNQSALRVCTFLLDHAAWLNSHRFCDVEVFEIRVLEGYGARWSADGSTFRGFLEPQSLEGHARGWRH